jgi:hypothetical protein
MVDGDGLVHEIRQRFGRGAVLTTTFSQFGRPVEIKAPPTAKIVGAE